MSGQPIWDGGGGGDGVGLGADKIGRADHRTVHELGDTF